MFVEEEKEEGNSVGVVLEVERVYGRIDNKPVEARPDQAAYHKIQEINCKHPGQATLQVYPR